MRLTVAFFTVFIVLTESAVSPQEETEKERYASLSSRLGAFEVLPLSSLQTHSVRRRDLQPQTHLEKRISFNALDRQFRLYLRTNDQLFTSDFRAVVVDQDGRESLYPVNRHNYFTGHVIGEENSRVQAHLDQHEFSAHILTEEAEYNVEPLWRFLATAPDDRLLIYRSDDITLSRTHQPSVCGYVTTPTGSTTTDQHPAHGDTHQHTHQRHDDQDTDTVLRSKRHVYDHERNTCPLLLVADHRFFKHMGREEESTTLNYLIELIDRVDDIYRNTSWDHEFKGYGVQIQQIIIEKSPTPVEPGKSHFNMRGSPVEGREVWDVKQLLEQFSVDMAQNASSVCLAHLFTYQDFDEGTLGLAYVAPRQAGPIRRPLL